MTGKNTKKTTNPKEAAVVKEKSDAVKAAAGQVTVDNALKKLTDVQVFVGKQLADIGQEVAAQVKVLETIRQAIELEKEELSRIYDVALLAKTNDEVQAEFEAKVKKAQDETDQFLESLKVKELFAKSDFERVTAALTQQRERDQDAYNYEFAQKKLVDQTKFEDEQRGLRRVAQDKFEGQQKDWNAREEVLKKTETDFASFKKQVEEFPTVLKNEVTKEVAIASNRIKREYEHQIELINKDFASFKSISESTTKNLNDVVGKLTIQLTTAESRVAKAEDNVRSIAEKALESASGNRTIAELQSLRAETTGNGRGKAGA